MFTAPCPVRHGAARSERGGRPYPPADLSAAAGLSGKCDKFSEVIHTIEQSYNVRINITCKNCPTDTFTGTLPLTNLNEVLEVIEKSYHLKAQIKGKEIILTDI